MKKQSIFITSLFITALLTSCDWFTSPEDLEPGRRDYVWTADTLDLEMNDFRSIWGSSPEDVWVGTFQNGENFHYDGETWIEHNEIGTSGYALYGFSKNDVWIGGGDGRIWHYDGTSWVENFRYIDPKFRDAIIQNFAARNSNDLYAVGMTFCEGNYNDYTENQRAFILHYDGYQWEEKFFADFQSQFVKLIIKNDNLYILSILINNMGEDTSTVYEVDNTSYSFYSILEESQYVILNNIDNVLYIIMHNSIYVYEKRQLIKSNLPQIQDIIHQIYGRHSKDLFVRTTNYIAHYNGSDIEYLFTFPNTWVGSVGGALILGEDIFFNCSDYENNVYYVLHGK